MRIGIVEGDGEGEERRGRGGCVGRELHWVGREENGFVCGVVLGFLVSSLVEVLWGCRGEDVVLCSPEEFGGCFLGV